MLPLWLAQVCLPQQVVFLVAEVLYGCGMGTGFTHIAAVQHTYRLCAPFPANSQPNIALSFNVPSLVAHLPDPWPAG